MSRHENSNQFKDGLLMDLHPLQTPNTVLTDNLNGTFITYNGNEYSLQNDMGNFKLRNCKLEPKYFPIGTTSYADTIYIVSYNPIDKLVQIGSYPAPVKYNDNPNGRLEKFYTISESFILNTFKSNPDASNLSLNASVISDYKTSFVFSGDEWRLKSGDEFIMEYDQLVKNGFEELIANVIYDSGKKQKVNLKYNKDYDSVPWSTAGNIEITSRIFDIDKCEVFIANEYYTKDKCHVDFQVDLFISDESFIKKINNSPNIFKDSFDSDSIWISPTTFNDATPSTRYVKTAKWLGEFLKISFIVSYDFSLTDQTTVKTYSINFTPIFNTSIVFFNKEENDSSQTHPLVIKFDTKQIDFDHVVDPSKNPFNKVGDKVFQWKYENDNWTILANGSDLDDNEGKMFYKIVKASDFDDMKYNDWYDGLYDPNSLCWTISESLDDCEFYYIFFKALEWITPDLDDNDEPIVPNPDDNDAFILSNNGSKYIDKRDLVNSEGRTCKVMFTKTVPADLENKDRYDMIPLEEFVKSEFNDEIYPDSIESKDVLLDLWTESDLNNRKNGILSDDKKSGFRKFFGRFDDSNVEFKSFMKIDDVPSGSELLYGVQEFKYSDNNNQSSNHSGIFKKGWIKSIKYDNGFDIKDIGTNGIFKGYFKISGELSVGDSFMFVDGLKYYCLKSSSFTESENRKFYATTIDKNGKKSNEYIINGAIFDWNGSGNYFPNYKSVDLGNYRSIRMFYPGIKHNGEYNKHGCCQVDFGASAAIGAKQGAIVGGATAMLHAGVGALVGSITGAIIGATKTLDYASIPNLCQYVGNFHKNIRKELDDSWNEHKPIVSGKKSELTQIDATTSELKVKGIHSAEVMLCARTLYRDKAQRPSFTNNSFTVDITPNWEKWTDERGPSDQSVCDQGISAHRTFIALPLYNTSVNLHKKDVNDSESIIQSIDYEDWWKVSSSEQHTVPQISGYEKINGVGLIAMSEYPHNKSDLDLAVAWVPNNPDAKFERYGRINIKLDTKVEHTPIKLYPTRIVPDSVEDQISKMKSDFPIDLDNIILLNLTPAFISGDEYESDNLFNTKIDVPELTKKYMENSGNDDTKLKQHKIFSYITAQQNPDTRIQKYPVAGVYPIRSKDQSDSALGHVFEGATGFSQWDKFKVDEEGRVYLTNLDASDNIYIKKNSNKTIFGYFPYLPNCDRWI